MTLECDPRVHAGGTNTISIGAGGRCNFRSACASRRSNFAGVEDLFSSFRERNLWRYPRQPGFWAEGMFIVPNPQLQVRTIVSMPFDENTYIAHLAGQNDCIVFDPGFEPDAIIAYLRQH